MIRLTLGSWNFNTNHWRKGIKRCFNFSQIVIAINNRKVCYRDSTIIFVHFFIEKKQTMYIVRMILIAKKKGKDFIIQKLMPQRISTSEWFVSKSIIFYLLYKEKAKIIQVLSTNLFDFSSLFFSYKSQLSPPFGLLLWIDGFREKHVVTIFRKCWKQLDTI